MTRKFLLLALAAGLWAQTDEWFQNREHNFKNRWEGLVGENQAGDEWEVRSFVASVEAYPPDRNVDLKVGYYVPDAVKAFVHATAINRKVSYLMVPKPEALRETRGWREFGEWRTSDVLLQRKISSTNLGVLIRLGADSETVRLLAPATVYFSGKPPAPAKYRLEFYTATATAKSSFTIVGQKGYSHKYDLARANARSLLPIEFEAAKIPDGLTIIGLDLVYEDASKRHLEWKFYQGRP